MKRINFFQICASSKDDFNLDVSSTIRSIILIVLGNPAEEMMVLKIQPILKASTSASHLNNFCLYL